MLLVMLSIQGLSALRAVLLAYRARLFLGAVLLMDCVVYAAFIVTLLFWVGHLMKKSGKAAKKN